MKAIEREKRITRIKIARAQIALIESDDLPKTRSKAENCEENGWDWLAVMFRRFELQLKGELLRLRADIDAHLDELARGE